MRALTLLLVLSVLSACQNVADPCSIERQAEVPVEIGGIVPVVSARLDGKPVTMILDSGAERTILTMRALSRLGIAFDFRRQMALHGLGAATTTVTARIGRFEVGGIVLRDRLVIVGPSASFPELPSGQPDGLLGADILSGYDMDLDLPHAVMTLYRARACPDGKPPWNAAYVTFRGRLYRSRLLIPIELDGQVLAAALDTGTSAGVIIDERAAARAGVAEQALDRDQAFEASGVTPNKVTVHLHRFNELEIGPEMVPNPVLPVAALPNSGFEALIGAGYLKARRAWLSYATARVFVLRPALPDESARPSP